MFDGRDHLGRSCPDRRVFIDMRIAWSQHGLRPVKSRNWSVQNLSKQEAAADLRASHGSARVTPSSSRMDAYRRLRCRRDSTSTHIIETPPRPHATGAFLFGRHKGKGTGDCLLLALSGHIEVAWDMCAFGGKADTRGSRWPRR